MIFWGAQNIAGESSLKIPYSTKAVNGRLSATGPRREGIVLAKKLEARK